MLLTMLTAERIAKHHDISHSSLGLWFNNDHHRIAKRKDRHNACHPVIFPDTAPQSSSSFPVLCLIWRGWDPMPHRHPDKVLVCMHKLGALPPKLFDRAISCVGSFQADTGM